MVDWVQVLEEKYGIALDDLAIKRFGLFYRELTDWNERINLTAIRDKAGIEIKHFLDSLTIISVTPKMPESIIDIGTGAGFPGLALKIVWPDAKLTLVESIKKKANFCQHVVDMLRLNDVNVLAQRAEKVGQNLQHREKYPLVTARAVAAMPVLLEYLLPLAKPGGLVVMQKGENGAKEAEESQKLMRKLGGDLKEVRQVFLPDVEGDRYLIVVSKNAHSPKEYPRATGLPAKTPLS